MSHPPMNRTLAILNLAGILLLTGLCVLQWQVNRQLNLSHIALEQQRGQQAAKITQQQTTIQGVTADLNDFRGRLAAADEALAQVQAKLQSQTAQQRDVTSERDQLQAANQALQTALNKWTAAVAGRDEVLKKAEAQLQTLTKAHNAAIAKFNDLAKDYNSSIGEIKKANDEIQQLIKDRDALAAKYNDLATRYNTIVQPKAPTTRP
jgi:chromosome segregation ATPase